MTCPNLAGKSFCAFALVLALVGSVVADGAQWLSIVASEKTLGDAVRKLQSLGGQGKALRIVSSSDCGNLRQGLFLVASGKWKSKAEAENDASKWRAGEVKDAYARQCEVKPESRLALGVPVLHSSIYSRPPEIVNWTYEDAVSRVKPLSDSVIAIVQPRYEPDPEDVREGLRIPVYVMTKSGGEPIQLAADCIDPELSANADLVAVSCVTGTMADHLVHVTRVYQIPSGKLILERDRCREPRLAAEQLSCREEELDKEGELSLNTKSYPLSAR